MTDKIDIRFTGRWESPFELLSNLAPKEFVFRGKRTKTIEGILQSLKVYDPAKQAEFWTMNGFEAKKAGRHINWQDAQVLWWDEKPIDRHGEEYQLFLDELFGQCFNQNKWFREALRETKGLEIDHSIGNTDPEFTILTVEEFLERLRVLRELT